MPDAAKHAFVVVLAVTLNLDYIYLGTEKRLKYSSQGLSIYSYRTWRPVSLGRRGPAGQQVA